MRRATKLGVISVLIAAGAAGARTLEESLNAAGENRPAIEAAIDGVSPGHADGMQWLVQHMPAEDLQSLSADFLIENVKLSYDAWERAPWHADVPEEIFFEAVLPYASVNERRERWRTKFMEEFTPLVNEASSTAEAATTLNRKVFPIVGVRYSTKRPKADQSPFESIDAGMASCTGLSVLLVDACRSVGVPARFVGTPLWTDGSGNHSWVEIWHDGDWHFTGAAEPAGDDLNRAWFADRAAGAIEGDEDHAIYAATWRDVPQHFPMSWRPWDASVGGIDVTRRYQRQEAAPPPGHGRLRVAVIDESGQRRALPVRIRNGSDEVVFSGTTRDERFDSNDHLYAELPLGASYTVTCDASEAKVEALEDQTLLTLAVPTTQAVSRELAEEMRSDAVRRWHGRSQDAAETMLDAGVISVDGVEMPIKVRMHGDPGPGKPLFISMHGGGGAPPEVNDKQWGNQAKMYPNIEDGYYIAPRAPSNTWNLWHQAHIDPLFDELITAMVLARDVDSDRVYLTGYSAGGDGTYQLAPRMADRFAAAGAMAGHPNETKADGLRNLAFALHMGGQDGAYDRNAVARKWKDMLASLKDADPDGYDHQVEIHEACGHWMENRERPAMQWMATKRRNLRPARVVWVQDDVTHDRFYWLAVDEPVARDRKVVELSGQVVTISQPGAPGPLRLRLDDDMVNLDEPIVVQLGDGTVLFEGVVPRTRAVIEKTLAERGDPRGAFTAEIAVVIPSASDVDTMPDLQ